MSCLTDCWELGPPPDLILALPPPPPLPTGLQHNATVPCLVGHRRSLCDKWVSHATGNIASSSGGGSGSSLDISGGAGYIDLPRQEWGGSNTIIIPENASADADTWLLVLISCSIGVLLLGALLALFLLRCREAMSLSYRHRQTQTKIVLPGHHQFTSNADSPQIKIPPLSSDAVLFPNGTTDNRLLWAALTPSGNTQHYISETYPQDFLENDNTYETIDAYGPQCEIPSPIAHYQSNLKTMELNLANEKASFDNTGFIDYDYEDPTPLIESYQLENIENEYNHAYAEVINPVITGSTLRRGYLTAERPIVSSPTRIEHPNLPPLNLHPQLRVGSSCSTRSPSMGGTLRRSTLSRKNSESNTFK